MFQKQDALNLNEIPRVKPSELQPSLQSDLLQVPPKSRYIGYKLAGCASFVLNKPPHLLTREDIINKDVVDLLSQQYGNQQPAVIFECRRFLRFLGDSTLIPYKYNPPCHPLVHQWLDSLNVRESLKGGLRRHCMMFLAWWTANYFPKYAPHEVPISLLQRVHYLQYRMHCIFRNLLDGDSVKSWTLIPKTLGPLFQ